MRSLWRRDGPGWWRIAAQVWRDVWADQLPGRCAELAYYFLFSLFPLLLFLSTLLGYLTGPYARLRRLLFVYLGRFSPSDQVTAFIDGTLAQVTASRHDAQLSLSLSLVVALWVASSGMLAIGRTLNTAYGIADTRSWVHRRLVALALTGAFAGLIVCALTSLVIGHDTGKAIAGAAGVGWSFTGIWHVVRWPLVLAFVLLALDCIYNFAPDVGSQVRRHWGTPGAVVGMGMGLAATFGLRAYLAEVGEYASVYGSLAVVIVMLLWFYLTALAILVGGEVNSAIFHELSLLRSPAGGAGAAAAPGAAAGPGAGDRAGHRAGQGAGRRGGAAGHRSGREKRRRARK